MSRKFRCIKSHKSGEWLTEGKFYEEDEIGRLTYDDGWKDNVDGFFDTKDGEDYLIEIKEGDEKVRERSIHITTDGTSTHAVLKDGKQVIKRAKVGLYHGDEYKFETGVMEVVKKLLDIVDEKKEIEDDGNFSVRCIKNDKADSGLTVGKVYKFVDGYSNWNSGNKFPSYTRRDINKFMNIDDLNKWLDDKNYGFELVETSSKQLSDYSTDELLSELRLRMEK